MITLEYKSREQAVQKIVEHVVEKIDRSSGGIYIALPFGGDGELVLRELADSLRNLPDLSSKKVTFYQSEEVVYPSEKGAISFRSDLVKYMEPVVGDSLMYLPSQTAQVKGFCQLIQEVSFEMAIASCSESGAILGLEKIEDENNVWYSSLNEVYGPTWRNKLEARFGSQPDDNLPSHFISLGSKAALFSGLLLVMVNGEKKRWVAEDISQKGGSSVLSKIIAARERKSLQTIVFTDVGH